MIDKRVLKLELKSLVGGRLFSATVIAFVVAGLFAIQQGVFTISSQREDISKILPQSRAEANLHLDRNRSDLGNALYYIKFDSIHLPSSWAPLAIGQRDVNPYHLGVRILTLEGQLYDNSITNPTTLLYGNFDLAFVIVFLLPLVMIALTFNVLSDDEENGVWRLIASQPASPVRLIVTRLAIRFAATFIVAIALLATGVVWAGSTVDFRFLTAVMVIFCYLTFWTGLAAIVISFRKSSSFNAAVLFGIWIIVAILAPSMLNLAVSSLYPASESFDVTVRQREGYHRKWDLPKRETMDRFYSEYPQYKTYPIPEDKFSWGWYYAMQHAGDLEAADAATRFVGKLRMRDDAIAAASWILPSVGTQSALFDNSGTGLTSHLAFLNSVRDLHRRAREMFYPLIFDQAPTSEITTDALPLNRFEGETENPSVKWAFTGNVILGTVFLLIAIRRLRTARPT